MREVETQEGCPKCEPVIAALRAKNGELQAQVATLLGRVAALEEKVRLDSTNSSKPPSSDGLPQTRELPKKRSHRRRGGQPGHPGRKREMAPPERVDHFVERVPKRCERCEQPLQGLDPEPRRHQQWELPPIRPVLTEYRLHRLACRCCGHLTSARLPQGVSESSFGPQVHAFASMLAGGYRLSHRQIMKFLREVFDLPISLGSISALERRTSQALFRAWQQLRDFVREEPSLHMDETRLDRPERKGYLWVAASEQAVLFEHCLSRAQHVARAMLGNDYRGIVHSDRYAVYDYWPDSMRQICWSHILRDFRRIAQRQDASAEIGAALLEEGFKLFEQWHRYGRQEIQLSSFRAYLSGIRCRVRQWLERGLLCGNSRTRNTCRKILEHDKALYSFARFEGVEPTNNHAERMLRHAVLWRKQSYWVQSAQGSVFVERILSVVQTLRNQGRDLWRWLTDAVRAHLHARPSPSLLPDPG